MYYAQNELYATKNMYILQYLKILLIFFLLPLQPIKFQTPKQTHQI